MNRFSLSAGALSVLAMAMAFASAASDAATTSFAARSTVASSCQIIQAPSMAFGAYDPLVQAGKQLTTEFVLRCTAGTTAVYQVNQGLYAGEGSTCASPLRNMRSENGIVLSYAINFADLGRMVVCSHSARQTYYFDTTSVEHRQTFRGERAPGQDASVGSYADTVTISVTF